MEGRVMENVPNLIHVLCKDCGKSFPCLVGTAASRDLLCLTCWRRKEGMPEAEG